MARISCSGKNGILLIVGCQGASYVIDSHWSMRKIVFFESCYIKCIHRLTNCFFAYFDHYPTEITTNDRSRFGKTKVNVLPVCRILCSMSDFDQKLFRSILWQLDTYISNELLVIWPRHMTSTYRKCFDDKFLPSPHHQGDRHTE